MAVATLITVKQIEDWIERLERKLDRQNIEAAQNFVLQADKVPENERSAEFKETLETLRQLIA